MNSRALRNHRLRNRAWALVVALLPATECWATDGQDVPATNPDTSAATSAASSPGTTDARSTRFRIPPPRQFTPEEIQARRSSPRQAGPKIPPPRQLVTAPEAQQPLFAPVSAQHQDAVSLFRPASEVPSRLQDVPKPGPTTGGVSAQANVSAPLLSPTSDPVSTSTASEPGAASGDLSQSLQGSGRTLKPEPTPAPESVAEPGSDRAAVAVAPPAREEPPAQGLAEPKGQGAESSPAPAPVDPATQKPAAPDQPPAQGSTAGSAPMPAALSQALQTLDATPRNSPAETAAAAPPSPAQVEASQAGAGQPKPDPAAEPKSNQDQGVSQAAKSAQSTARAPGQAPAQSQDHQVKRTGCATCGGFHSSLEGGAFHASMGCANGNCIPGRPPCNPPCNECNTVIDAFCQNLYQCLCCPDPCYQPSMGTRGQRFVLRRLRPAPHRDSHPLRQPRGHDAARPQPVLDQSGEAHDSAQNRTNMRDAHQSHGPAPAGLPLPGGGGRARQLLRRSPLPADQLELGADPGRLRRHQLRHQVAPVRLRDAPDHLPDADLHAQRQLHEQPGDRPVRGRPLDPDVAEAQPQHVFPGPVRQLDPGGGPGRESASSQAASSTG